MIVQEAEEVTFSIIRSGDVIRIEEEHHTRGFPPCFFIFLILTTSMLRCRTIVIMIVAEEYLASVEEERYKKGFRERERRVGIENLRCGG